MSQRGGLSDEVCFPTACTFSVASFRLLDPDALSSCAMLSSHVIRKSPRAPSS